MFVKCFLLTNLRLCYFISVYLLILHQTLQKEVLYMPKENKVSKTQQRAVHKHVKNNYNRMDVTCPQRS